MRAQASTGSSDREQETGFTEIGFLGGRAPAPVSAVERTSSARRLVEEGVFLKSSSWSVSMQGNGGGAPELSS